MFNPFKKKEKEFKLDESTLPSLTEHQENQVGSSTSGSLNPHFDENPNINLHEETPNFESQSFAGNTQPNQNPGNNPFQNNLSSNNSFNSLANTTPGFSSNPNPNTYQEKPNNYQNDLLLAKVESMESKISLSEAKLTSIEQKLELLYRMFLEEVSEETKKKLNIQDMMSSVKNK